MIAWKIFRDGKQPRTLYHTLQGSSELPLDKVLEAKQSIVANPGKWNAGDRRFRAGFHFFSDKKTLVRYSRSMTKNYVVCAVEVFGKTRKKPGSRAVMLGTRMRISTTMWEQRIRLQALLNGN